MTTVLAAPNPAAALLLIALNSSGRHIYAGTVPPQDRRAANKVARLSRRANRNHR